VAVPMPRAGPAAGAPTTPAAVLNMVLRLKPGSSVVTGLSFEIKAEIFRQA